MRKTIIISIVFIVIVAVGIFVFFYLKNAKTTQEVTPTSTTTEEISPTVTSTSGTNESGSIDSTISDMDKDMSGLNPNEDFKTFQDSDIGL